MDSELEKTPETNYSHLWLLLLLSVLYLLANKDRIGFEYLSHHLFKGGLEIKTMDKNVRTEDTFSVDIDVYQKIVQGGNSYLPLVIMKLQTDKRFIWNELMRDMTGVDIYQYARQMRWLRMSQDTGDWWIKWWAMNKDHYQFNDR